MKTRSEVNRLHNGYLCLGCNADCEKNVRLACRELETFLSDVYWGEARWTQPVDFSNPALFCNRVAFFCTDLEVSEVREQFKRIERLCGRTSSDKANGIVKMDIDLLAFDHRVLKPEDWERDYVKTSVKELSLTCKKTRL